MLLVYNYRNNCTLLRLLLVQQHDSCCILSNFQLKTERYLLIKTLILCDRYRKKLREADNSLVFVHLEACEEILIQRYLIYHVQMITLLPNKIFKNKSESYFVTKRLRSRSQHFVTESLLSSQLETLERPHSDKEANTVVCCIDSLSIPDVCRFVCNKLRGLYSKELSPSCMLESPD